MTDRVFYYFGPFFFDRPNNLKNQNFENMKKTTRDIIILILCNTNDNHMIYGSRDMERDRQNDLSFWTIFCLLTLEQPRKSKFGKNEKKSLEILSSYTCVP